MFAWFMVIHCLITLPVVLFFIKKWWVVFIFLMLNTSLFQFMLDFCEVGEDCLHLHHKIIAIELFTLVFTNVLKTLFLNRLKQFAVLVLDVLEVNQLFASTWEFIPFEARHRLITEWLDTLSLTKGCELTVTVQHWLFDLLLNFRGNVNAFFFDFTKHPPSFFSELFARSSFMLWIYCFNALTYRGLMHTNLFLASQNFSISLFFIWRRFNFPLRSNSSPILNNNPPLKQVFVFKVPALRVLFFNSHELKITWILLCILGFGYLLPLKVLEKAAWNIMLTDKRNRIVFFWYRLLFFNRTLSQKPLWIVLIFRYKDWMRQSFSASAAWLTCLLSNLFCPFL